MRVDSHVHLQPHGEKPQADRARLEQYVAAAAVHGIDQLAITEHLFRFREAYDLLAGWWDKDPNPGLAAMVKRYWDDHVNLRLGEYVALVEQAKSDGLPVALGIEMDWIPGKLDELRGFLAPYAWDVVLGSVHWIGAFGFDDADFLDEWSRRDVDAVFDAYAQLIGELADSRLADVLAHPDLPKLFGHHPNDLERFHGALVTAAIRGGCAIEINTNGLRKPGGIYPDPALLRRAHLAGLPITLASDAHTPDRVGADFGVATAHARAAGYKEFSFYRARRRTAAVL